MFKKHMTPLQPHTKKSSLDVTTNKGSSQRLMPSAASGGMPNMQSYGKATPMADQPAPSPDGLGSGSFGGIVGS